MKHLATIFALALLASCYGPTPEPPPQRTFEPSIKRPEIGSTAAAVDRVARDARREADALRNQVGILRRTASEATSAAGRADSELQRLIVQQSATEEELINLGGLFKDAQQRNMFLEAEAEELERSHDAMKETIGKLEDTIRHLRTAATEKDNEVAELRKTAAEASDYADRLQAANEELAKRASKAEVSDAESGAYGKLVWAGVAILAVVGLVWVALTVWKPRFIP